MAYGFDMFTHYSYGSTGENDQRCVDRETGEKTQSYYDVQTANREVLRWDHVYLNYGWKGTAAVYSGSPTALMSTLENGQVKAIGSIAGITAMTEASVSGSPRSALIGQFEDGQGNDGYMITNATNPSDNQTTQVNCKFANGYAAVLVYTKGVPEIVPLGADNSAVIDLESGEGKFVIPLRAK